MAKKWTDPWSVSSSLLGFQYSRGPASVWDPCHSARCCECTPHHLHGKDGSVYRKGRDGQVLRLRKHKKYDIFHIRLRERVRISFPRGILPKLAMPDNLFKGMGSHSIKRLYLLHFN